MYNIPQTLYLHILTSRVAATGRRKATVFLIFVLLPIFTFLLLFFTLFTFFRADHILFGFDKAAFVELDEKQ